MSTLSSLVLLVLLLLEAEADGASVVVAAVLAVAEDPERRLDLVGVIPDAPSMSLAGSDFEEEAAAPPTSLEDASFLEEMVHHSATPVTRAARPMTTYVVWWLLEPIFDNKINDNK